ncbi:MAG TPA: thioesterase family protein [Baekduia sp.]|nr:thioesterase family protein [Baekduia sp.]
MTEPVFRREGSLFVPTAHAVGPWDVGQLHGGAPAVLVARAVEALEAPVAMRTCRITMEFLGAVPAAPLQVQAEVLRGGPRLQLCEATLSSGDGKVLVRARAVRLREGDVDLRGRGAQETATPFAGPETGVAPHYPGGAGPEHEGFHLTGMDIRFLEGAIHLPGPGHAWFRPARPFVDDEPVSPLQRAVAAADFGNGVSSELDWDALFVNTDLTVSLLRPPAGEWVLLDSRTLLDRGGSGVAISRLWDAAGELGTAQQTLFVDRR